MSIALWKALTVKFLDSQNHFWAQRFVRGTMCAELTEMRFLKVILFGVAFSFFPFQFLQAQPMTNSNNFSVTTSEIQHKIQEDIMKVAEFKVLREQAQKRGVKLYLFGGTAAGFAHYAKWDLQRLKGDKTFQPDRFDFELSNIYRASQDLDIVIDGPIDVIKEMNKSMADFFPSFAGDKSKWEIRSLRESIGKPGQKEYKEALLNSFDFLNQNTDSNSTGLIEVTPATSETIVSDLRDMSSNPCQFLKDVTTGTLHYYTSEKHFETSRAKIEENPKIYSVVRALTKALQYDSTITPESMHELQKIVDEFDPESIHGDDNRRRFNDMASKLIKQSLNLERTWNFLESIGLRQKLLKFKSRPSDGVAFWLSKEPLRTFPLGEGTGKTAREIGLNMVAHTTSGEAYDSIVKSRMGEANVFISREGPEGEQAANGNGFYTRIGSVGQWKGITVRFHLHPDARFGTDFLLFPPNVLVLNKAAIKVIPESLQLSMFQYIKALHDDVFDLNDGALRMRYSRKFETRRALDTSDEEKQVVEMVRDSIFKNPTKALRSYWFQQTISLKYPEIAAEWLKLYPQAAAENILTQKIWKSHPEFIEELLKNPSNDDTILMLLQKPHWNDHPEWVKILIERGGFLDRMPVGIFSAGGWHKHPELMNLYLKKAKVTASAVSFITKTGAWTTVPKLASYFLDLHDEQIDIEVSRAHVRFFAQDSTLLNRLLALNNPEVDKQLAHRVLEFSGFNNQLLEILLTRKTCTTELIHGLSSKSLKELNSEKISKVLEHGAIDDGPAESLLSNPLSENHPEWFEKIILSRAKPLSFTQRIQHYTTWFKTPVVKTFIKDGGGYDSDASNLLSVFAKGARFKAESSHLKCSQIFSRD